MTETENLVLLHLRELRNDLASFRAETQERLTHIEVHLSTLGQQVGALTTAVYSGKSEMDDLKRRVERIERRLELQD